MNAPQLKGEDGQTLILVMLALPLLLAIAALVLDGSNLFVQKRSVQNAADAAAFAAAKDLPAAGTQCTGACLATLGSDAERYSSLNNGPPLHACDDSSGPDTNCYLTPFQSYNDRVQVRLRKPVSGFFTRAVGLWSASNVSASAVAGLSPAAVIGQVAPIAVIQSDPKVCQPSNPSYPNCFDQPGVVLDFDNASGYALLDLSHVSTSGPIAGSSVSSSTYFGWIDNGFGTPLPSPAWYAAEGNNGCHSSVGNHWTVGQKYFVPVFDVRDATTGSYHVVGFSVFVIDPGGVGRWTGNCPGTNHNLTGHFESFIATGSGGGGTNFGVSAITLFE